MRRVEVGHPFKALVFVSLNTDGETGAEGLSDGSYTVKQYIKGDGTTGTITTSITADNDYGWYVLSFTAAQTDVVGDFAVHLEGEGITTLNVKVAEITPRSTIRRV